MGISFFFKFTQSIQMENIIKGDELMVFINGHSIAFATSHTFAVTGNTIEMNCKDTGFYTKQDIGNMTWEITSENLYTDAGYDTLFDAMINRILTTVIFGYADDYDENGLSELAPYWQPDSESGYYVGEAYISSLTANANTGENATFSVTFTGHKALNTTNEPIPDTPTDPVDLVGEIGTNYVLSLIEDVNNTYALKYEDSTGTPIANFNSLKVSEYNLITENIAPYLATQMGAYTSDGTRLGTVKLNTLKKNFGTRKYRFGVLSDVHYDASDNNLYDASNDFRNAITFFENHEDVDFVVIPGDMSLSQSAGVYTDFEYLKSDMQQFAPTTPIFIARGNHDMGCLSSLTTAQADAKWNEYVTPLNSNIIGITPTYQYDNGNQTANFYFTYQGDVFIFLSLYSNNFWPAPTGTKAFLESSYQWLADLLEANKNKRVFVIEHLYLKDKAGNYRNHYNSSFNSWFTCNGDYDAFNTLNNQYKNSIWIQGHTHFKLNLQRDYDRANITNINPDGGTCGYNVHISSCGCPRDSDPTVAEWSSSMIHNYNQSEGAIIDVYDDYIDYRGIVFKDLSLQDAPEGQWIELDSQYVDIDTSKSGYVNTQTINSDENYDINVTFTAKAQRFFINHNSMGITNECKIRSVQVLDGNGNDVTATLLALSDPKIGIYGTDSKYHLSGEFYANIWSNPVRLELPISSSFSAATLPITLKMNISFKESVPVSSTYCNLYEPLAQYRIPVNNQGVQS